MTELEVMEGLAKRMPTGVPRCVTKTLWHYGYTAGPASAPEYQISVFSKAASDTQHIEQLNGLCLDELAEQAFTYAEGKFKQQKGE